jgi:hypothetical protein
MQVKNGWKNSKERNWKKKKQMEYSSLMMRKWNKGEKLLISVFKKSIHMLIIPNRLKHLILSKISFNPK